ncbi:MAG: hypothetical protein IT430_03665 [Phycisphaerales bacterium]|nr:hypothetical protein [Phycisphaerales bacterium]
MNQRQLIAFADRPILADDALSKRYLRAMGFLDAYKRSTARVQAVAIAEQMEREPEGMRAVHPYYVLGYEMKSDEYPIDVTAIYERGEIVASEDTRTCGYLGAELSKRGIELDLVYHDAETDLSPWSQGLKRIIDVYKSDAARERMPEDLRGYDVAKLKVMTPEYNEWIIKFGRYADRLKIEALRKITIESGLMSAWGERTAAVNFFNIRTSFTVHDYNGWPYRQGTLVDDRTSCPVCFLTPQGQRYDRREHHRYWNSFIDLLNHARSGAAMGPFVPVIREAPRPKDGHIPGTMDRGGRWMLEHLMAHLIRTGARMYMYFHPACTAADDRSLAEVMDKHAAALPATNPTLPEIKLDVDEVVTGGWKTTYAEFLEQQPDRWPGKTG